MLNLNKSEENIQDWARKIKNMQNEQKMATESTVWPVEPYRCLESTHVKSLDNRFIDAEIEDDFEGSSGAQDVKLVGLFKHENGMELRVSCEQIIELQMAHSMVLGNKNITNVLLTKMSKMDQNILARTLKVGRTYQKF